MSHQDTQSDALACSIEFHFVGRIDFEQCATIQQRLVYEAAGRTGRRIDVLFCELPEMITVGRSGSRAHIRLSGDELLRRQLDVRWVNRGGGCVLHRPGQLAVYPIVPLLQLNWTIGEYMRRLQRAIYQTLEAIGINVIEYADQFGVCSRSGWLSTFGVAVRNWVTYHGSFINVCPKMTEYGYIDVAKCGEKTTMSCLLAERRRPVRMTEVRSILVEHLADQFGADRYHLHTGHPLLIQEKSIA